jgi:hypothetical protein
MDALSLGIGTLDGHPISALGHWMDVLSRHWNIGWTPYPSSLEHWMDTLSHKSETAIAAYSSDTFIGDSKVHVNV